MKIVIRTLFVLCLKFIQILLKYWQLFLLLLVMIFWAANKISLIFKKKSKYTDYHVIESVLFIEGSCLIFFSFGKIDGIIMTWTRHLQYICLLKWCTYEFDICFYWNTCAQWIESSKKLDCIQIVLIIK